MKNISQKPDSDNQFEQRIKARRERILAANRHRVFRCIECGERYTYDWVYQYGMICSEGCDGELMEVRL
jgi:transcription initiation factor IIE alpha subunit